jgi:hypothetical protein
MTSEQINDYHAIIDKNMIDPLTDYEERVSEYDLCWFIPKDEILDEQYERLYYEGLNYKH